MNYNQWKAPLDALKMAESKEMTKQERDKLITDEKLGLSALGYIDVISSEKYTIATHPISVRSFIRCNTCNLKSYHPDDIKYKWCEECEKFHEPKLIKRVLALNASIYSYVDFNEGLQASVNVLRANNQPESIIEKIFKLKRDI